MTRQGIERSSLSMDILTLTSQPLEWLMIEKDRKKKEKDEEREEEKERVIYKLKMN